MRTFHIKFGNKKYLSDIIARMEYTWKISWFRDSCHVAFSDSSGFVSIIDIATRKVDRLIKGYDPQVSPDEKKILYIRKNIINSPIPCVYDRNSDQINKIHISRVFGAIWSPTGEQIIIVRNDSNIFKYWDLSEYHTEIILYDIKTKEKRTLLNYKGYNDISVTSEFILAK